METNRWRLLGMSGDVLLDLPAPLNTNRALASKAPAQNVKYYLDTFLNELCRALTGVEDIIG